MIEITEPKQQQQDQTCTQATSVEPAEQLTKKPLNSILSKQNNGSVISRQSSLKNKHQGTDLTLVSLDESTRNKDIKIEQEEPRQESPTQNDATFGSDFDKGENIPLVSMRGKMYILVFLNTVFFLNF